jgi:hypothetical protein
VESGNFDDFDWLDFPSQSDDAWDLLNTDLDLGTLHYFDYDENLKSLDSHFSPLLSQPP